MLATWVPKDLHRRARLYCVGKGIMLMDFVTEALTEKLHPKASQRAKVR
jgi:hypothetical protein